MKPSSAINAGYPAASVAQVTQVEGQLREVGNNLDSFEKSVAALSEKLGPILRQENHATEKLDAAPPDVMLCDRADSLRKFARAIGRIEMMVMDLRERTEA